MGDLLARNWVIGSLTLLLLDPRDYARPAVVQFLLAQDVLVQEQLHDQGQELTVGFHGLFEDQEAFFDICQGTLHSLLLYGSTSGPLFPFRSLTGVSVRFLFQGR